MLCEELSQIKNTMVGLENSLTLTSLHFKPPSNETLIFHQGMQAFRTSLKSKVCSKELYLNPAYEPYAQTPMFNN